MGDGPHHATAGLQMAERLDGVVERLGVERTEPLVDEQRLEHMPRAGTALAHHIGEAERQRQRGLETFATRQRHRGPALARVRVEHGDVETGALPAALGLCRAHERVASVRHALQVLGGRGRDSVEFGCQHPGLEADTATGGAVADLAHGGGHLVATAQLGRAGSDRPHLVNRADEIGAALLNQGAGAVERGGLLFEVGGRVVGGLGVGAFAGHTQGIELCELGGDLGRPTAVLGGSGGQFVDRGPIECYSAGRVDVGEPAGRQRLDQPLCGLEPQGIGGRDVGIRRGPLVDHRHEAVDQVASIADLLGIDRCSPLGGEAVVVGGRRCEGALRPLGRGGRGELCGGLGHGGAEFVAAGGKRNAFAFGTLGVGEGGVGGGSFGRKHIDRRPGGITERGAQPGDTFDEPVDNAAGGVGGASCCVEFGRIDGLIEGPTRCRRRMLDAAAHRAPLSVDQRCGKARCDIAHEPGEQLALSIRCGGGIVVRDAQLVEGGVECHALRKALGRGGSSGAGGIETAGAGSGDVVLGLGLVELVAELLVAGGATGHLGSSRLDLERCVASCGGCLVGGPQQQRGGVERGGVLRQRSTGAGRRGPEVDPQAGCTLVELFDDGGLHCTRRVVRQGGICCSGGRVDHRCRPPRGLDAFEVGVNSRLAFAQHQMLGGECGGLVEPRGRLGCARGHLPRLQGVLTSGVGPSSQRFRHRGQHRGGGFDSSVVGVVGEFVGRRDAEQLGDLPRGLHAVQAVPLGLGVDRLHLATQRLGLGLHGIDRSHVEVRPEQLAQQLLPVCCLGEEELVERSLGQQDDLLELLGAEPEHGDALGGDGVGLAGEALPRAVDPLVQRRGGRAHRGAGAAGLGLLLCGRPLDQEATTADLELERHLGGCARRGVLRPHVAHLPIAGDLAVERVGERIEDGALARTGGPGDAEQTEFGKGAEVHLLGLGIRPEGLDAQMQRPHAPNAVSMARWSTARWSSVGATSCSSVQYASTTSAGDSRRRCSADDTAGWPLDPAACHSTSTTCGYTSARRVLACSTGTGSVITARTQCCTAASCGAASNSSMVPRTVLTPRPTGTGTSTTSAEPSGARSTSTTCFGAVSENE